MKFGIMWRWNIEFSCINMCLCVCVEKHGVLLENVCGYRDIDWKSTESVFASFSFSRKLLVQTGFCLILLNPFVDWMCTVVNIATASFLIRITITRITSYSWTPCEWCSHHLPIIINVIIWAILIKLEKEIEKQNKSIDMWTYAMRR